MDRRRDARVLEGDARGVERRARRGDLGLGPPVRGLRVVVLLLRHRLDLDELSVALGQQPGRHERRLGPREGRLGAVIVGLVQRRIDLVQHLPGLDLLALGEQAPLDEAADLRAHLGDHDRHRTAGQLGGHRHGLGRQCDDGDFRRRRRVSRRRRAAGDRSNDGHDKEHVSDVRWYGPGSELPR